MNLIEALRTDKPLRRLIPSHVGSNGDGWLCPDLVIAELITVNTNLPEPFCLGQLVNKESLLADDWEVKD